MSAEEKEEPTPPATESFAELLAASTPSTDRPQPGQVLEVRVVAIGEEWVFLDVGGKGEGMLDRRELGDENGTVTVAVGDLLRVWFVGNDEDGMKFTTRAGTGAGARDQIEDAFRNRLPVAGVVGGEVKGGFEVRLGEIRAFCPFSQMDLRRIEKPTDYVGQQYDFVVTEFGEEGRNIVLSRRVLLEEAQRLEREAVKARLKEGMTVTGIVTGVRDFGAFVNIGGIEGLIPLSEVGWSRTADIREAISTGQEVTVAIKALDWERDRITLSLKDTQADPWHGKAGEIAPGSVLSGTVVRLTPFGAFVRLAEGVDGLIHISKLGGGKRIKHPREAVKEGQKIEVKVESVDREKKRISLAPAGFEESEEGAKELKEYQQKADTSAKSMGTLGDLLKRKLGEKNG
jgi:small subunit ribosomal protein S1